MIAIARAVGRWRLLPIGAVVAVVALVSVPVGSQPGAKDSSVTKAFALHSALAFCPTIDGTNVWSGTWGLGSAASGGGVWALTLTASGTAVSGYVTAGPFDDTFISGSIVCNALTLQTLPNVYPEVSSTGTITSAGALSGNWTATLSSGATPVTGQWEASNVTVPNVSITPSAPLSAALSPVTYTAILTGTGPPPTAMMTISDANASGPVGTPCTASLVANATDCSFNEDVAGGPYTITATYPGDGFYDAITTSLTAGGAVSNGISATSGPTNQVTVTAAGGVAGTDTVTNTSYDVPPVEPLSDGSNYFDVAASGAFSDVAVTDCNGVTASTVMEWFDPLANGGFGGWEAVVSDNPPVPTLGAPVYGAGCLTATLDGSSTPSVADLTGTVFGTVPITGRTIDSGNSATATAGSRLSITILTTGSPTPSISKKGRLPSGVHLVGNPNGTATITGTPGPRSGGVYEPTIRATYGQGSTKVTVTQVLELVVDQAPTFKTTHLPGAHVGTQYRHTLKTRGYPAPTLTRSGALPVGVTFTDNGNGTATLMGTPAAASAGSYDVAVTASNGTGGPVTETFSFVVHG